MKRSPTSFRSTSQGVERSLAKLDEREAYVLRGRYGLGTGEEHTLEALGRELGISQQRVRQIEMEALEQLGRPTHAEMLKGFLDDAAVPERTPRPQKGERKRTSRKSRSTRLRVQELRAGTA